MPTMSPDNALYARLSAFVARHDHNQSAAARALGVPKELINRPLRSRCAVVDKTRHRLLAALDAVEHGDTKGHQPKTHQTLRVDEDVRRLALTVVQFISEAVARA
jgi:Zn-dependent peptidase ImmA (M78 family)